MASEVKRYQFGPERRLRGRRAFGLVYEANVRQNRGPLSVLARPNESGLTKLGLSVSRKVGKAVVRNRIKRRLREAFRLMQHELPGGYDVVVVVRRHEPCEVKQYQAWLDDAMQDLDAIWQRRLRRERSRDESGGQGS